MKSRKLLKRNYGKVFLTFNEPVLLSELQEKHGDSTDNMIDIAYDLTRRINDTITVSPYSILFTSILSSTGKGFSREKLDKFTLYLRDYLQFRNITLPKELLDNKKMSEESKSLLEELQEEGIINPLPVDGSSDKVKQVEDFFVINSEERPRITFYKNTILHYFLSLVYTSTALAVIEGDEPVHMKSIVETFKLMVETFKNEFVYDEKIVTQPEEEIRTVLSFMENQSVISTRGDVVTVNSTAFPMIQDTASLVQDILESYIVAGKTLLNLEKPVTKKELGNEMRKTGVTMYHLEEINLPESLSVPNYNNALKFLTDAGAISLTPRTKKEIDVKITDATKIEAFYNSLSKFTTTMHITSIKKGRSVSSEKSVNIHDNIH